MSYDLYSYKPTSGAPNVEEAEAFVLSLENALTRNDEAACATVRKIVDALLAHNPALQPFTFSDANHIELNPPEGGLAVQLEVYCDHVFVTTPYWYNGTEAELVFSQLSAYLRVIHKAVGFFAYDPQTRRAFDPVTEELSDRTQYEKIAKDLPLIVAKGLSPD